MANKFGSVPLSSDILTKANIGLWAFELDEGQPPRMYGDEAMLRLVGLDHQVPPEEMYHAWYDHIDEGSYGLVADAVDKMMNGEHAEVQYPWHHPDGRIIIVRCGGVRNTAYSQGIRIEGTHQNVTEVLHYDEEKLRSLERQKIELVKAQVRADALDFLSGHEPDVDRFREFFGRRILEISKCDQVIFRDVEGQRTVFNAPGIEDIPQHICSNCPFARFDSEIYAEGSVLMNDCSKGFHGVMSHPECPAKSSLMQQVYSEGKLVGLLTAHYLQKQHTFSEDGIEIMKTVATYFGLMLGRIKAKQAEQQQLLQKAEESQKLIDSYIETFDSVYVVNLPDGSMDRCVISPDVIKKVGAVSNFSRIREVFLSRFCHPVDKNTMSVELEFDTIRAKLSAEPSYSVEFCSINNGATVWKEMRVTSLGENKIIIGIVDDDIEIAKRHLEEKRFSEYFAIFAADLDMGTLRIIRNEGVFQTFPIGKAFPYTVVMKAFASHFREEDSRDFFYQISDPADVRRKLAVEDKYTFSFRGKTFGDGKWIDMTSYVLRRNDQGIPVLLTIGFSMVDSLGAERQELQRKLHESLTFTDYFLGTYVSAYYVGLEDNSCQVYKRTEKLARDYPSISNFSFGLRDYISRDVHPDDRAELLEITSLENLKKEVNGQAEFTHVFRDISGGVEKIYRLQAIRGADEAHMALGFRDITSEVQQQQAEQNRLQDALEKANTEARRNDLLYDIVNGGKWVYDIGADGEVVAAHYSDKTRGLSDTELSGTPMGWLDRLHPEDKERVAAEFKAAVSDRSGNTTYDTTFRVLESDGSYRWVKSAGRLLRREDGSGELLGMSLDITEQIEKERERQQQLEKALALAESASEAKTNFLFNMSHDIRTPMNAIKGFANIAIKHIDEKDRVLDALSKVQMSGDMLLALINSVLEVSSIESGKAVIEENPGDVYYSFVHVEGTLQELAETKDIKLSFEFENIKNRFVCCDFTRCLRIFVNVISNAIKYTPEGGEVKVRCEQLGEAVDGVGRYQYTISDNGIGMSEEFQKHVFEQFSRERTSTVSGVQGTGLGMAVVKSFVDLLGGTISVKSKQGVGTTFTIVLPFKLQEGETFTDPLTGEVKGAAAESETREEIDFSGRKVLLVEDNELNREIALAVLEESGLVVDTAEDGDIAVDSVKEKGVGYYDVVLMDIQMPRMNGYEATKLIRQLPGAEKLPIIALSANAFEEDRRKSREAGMNDHVAKPIDVEVLKATLAKFL